MRGAGGRIARRKLSPLERCNAKTMTINAKRVCQWPPCGAPLPAKRRSTKRFCCDAHRIASHRAKRRKPKPMELRTLGHEVSVASAVAEFAERYCVATAGDREGQPLKLGDWQRRWLADAFAEGVVESALCLPRKQGKTALLGVVLAAHLLADWSPRNWRCLAASIDGETVGELRQLTLACLESATEKNPAWQGAWTFKGWPPPGRMLAGKREVRFVNAGKWKGIGVGCDLVVFDELGATDEGHRQMVSKLYSSLVQRRGRLIAIGAKYRSPLYAELASRASSPHVHYAEYSASDPSVDLRDADALLAAIREANPGLGDITPLEPLLQSAERAKLNPADEAEFRADVLNAPVAVDRELIVSLGDWQTCTSEEPAERSGPCYVGIDAGGSASMTALAAYWPASGLLEAWAGFPATPPLPEREQADRVAPRTYGAMRDEGSMRTYPGRVTPLGAFLRDCGDRLAGCQVAAAGADRFRQAEVLQALESAEVRWPVRPEVSWRGQGAGATADGSHDVRQFQRAVLSRTLSTKPTALLAHAIAESKLRYDAAGNPALDKSTRRSRIDCLQAAVIAVGLAAASEANPPRSGFQFYGVAQ